MKDLFYITLPFFVIIACLAGAVRFVMIFVKTEWLCIALSFPVSAIFFALVFKLICRDRKSTMPAAELEAIWQKQQLSGWDEIKAEIDNGAEIVRDTSSPLSWRMLWGHERVYLAREGKKIRTLYEHMS
jgi:hypothetical protein